jgi:hypothetical protein
LKQALPHWTVYKFIDELRKLFNASFIFDEIHKTVTVRSTNELLNNGTANYPCDDEFTSEYDEDGLSNYLTSNVEYGFDSAVNRDWREYISLNVQNAYDMKEYGTINQMTAAAEAMTAMERKTTIFKVGYNYYIWADMPKDGNPDSEETEERRTQVGFFNPIVRDKDSDDMLDIDIIPVAIYQRTKWTSNEANINWRIFDKMYEHNVVIPSMANDKEASIEDMTVDEDTGNYYYSVQDAMENGSEEATEDSDADSEKMPVFFSSNYVVNLDKNQSVKPDDTLDGENKKYRWPVAYTDYRMYPTWTGSLESASLSLNKIPARKFGGGSSSTSTANVANIDKNDQICIKFYTDEIPDPSNIYIFRNKKYICEKVEIEVTNQGVEKAKTGYFYEIL